ncbi:AHH domain-containing protein [Paenibacillus sp. F411]|nr:AHH domain-containing protein [Paenibacillus sp. F411]
MTYGYNAENERTWMNVKGQTTLYVVNPHAEYSQLLLETDEAGRVSAAYVYGLGLIGRESADGRYQSYHYDLRGSTTRLTDEEGDVTDRYTYGAFGELVKHEGTTRQPFAYNGRDGVQTDINGLYYMRARYYNPDIKRFMNRDVLRGEVSLGLSMNRFAYVNGNPVTFVDPLGLDAIQAGKSKGTTKPLQKHHYATNKSKKYTPQMENITKKYGLDLDDEWNKELLAHQGRHPYAYHDYVLDKLSTYDRLAKGDREKFLKLYEGLKQEVRDNPDMLYKEYWRSK